MGRNHDTSDFALLASPGHYMTALRLCRALCAHRGITPPLALSSFTASHPTALQNDISESQDLAAILQLIASNWFFHTVRDEATKIRLDLYACGNNQGGNRDSL
jgi:hypothetical protein